MAKQTQGRRTGDRGARFKNQKSQLKSRMNLKVKNGVKKRLNPNKTQALKIQDARQKIIQKKRKTVVDARDVLAKMAKTQDARNKLDKIRNGRDRTQPNSNVKVIGSNILRKTDRNGKISLVTNKTKSPSDMNLAIQKQLGLVSAPRSAAKKLASAKRSPQMPKSLPVLRKSVLNEMNYPFSTPASKVYESATTYKWSNPDLRTASQMINSLESTRQAVRSVMREELMASKGWADYVNSKPLRLQPSGYVDLDSADTDEEMPLAAPSRISLQGSTRISNVHSRLDNAIPHSDSHGILAQTKTKVVVPAGHRIVVSNLQPTVTQDDIKELFEDIGQLLTARLVRPGVAEVIYKNLKDAQKAVDTYHNRQLDGQPMKCLLVNKRPVNQPTALPLPKSDGILSARKNVVVSSASGSNKLVPDISTIHKVLFQRK